MSNVYTLSFLYFKMFFIYHCIPVINLVKNYQLNSTGMNFLLAGFLTAKFWLKISGKNLEKLLKALPFSKFLYRFAKNAKNWIPSKKQKKDFLKFRFWIKLLVVRYFSYLPKIWYLVSLCTYIHCTYLHVSAVDIGGALLILVDTCWYWFKNLVTFARFCFVR